MSPLLELLYQAYHSPLGIVVACNDAKLVQQKLYKARTEAKDPDLMQLQVRISPFLPEEELWIVNAKKGNGADDAPHHPAVSG